MFREPNDGPFQISPPQYLPTKRVSADDEVTCRLSLLDLNFAHRQNNGDRLNA